MTGLGHALRDKPIGKRSSAKPVIKTDKNLPTTLNSAQLVTMVKNLSQEITDLRSGLKDLKFCGRNWKENGNLYRCRARRIY